MTSRIASPDTSADRELRALLDQRPLQCFRVIAGAGSGKTTTLVKALAHVATSHGKTLRARSQKIACITYTDIAAEEIRSDVKQGSIFHVSTIHTFLWTLINPFQHDIGLWVTERIQERLEEEIEAEQGFSNRVGAKRRQETRKRIERYERQAKEVVSIRRFTYGTGSNYGKGIVGHDDVIKLATAMLVRRPLLAQLTVAEYPYIFVDESQDTFPAVVDALRGLALQHKGKLCLGFFGDPMQRIYATGVGSIGLDAGWKDIKKPENFRSPLQILTAINAIRSGGDNLVQKSGLPIEKQREGDVTVIVAPRTQDSLITLHRVRRWLADRHCSDAWLNDDAQSALKVLVITHRMAARRLGFETLYACFHDGASASLSQAFDEGTAWPLTPFRTAILAMAATSASSSDAMTLLRIHSPRIQNIHASDDLTTVLSSLKHGLTELAGVVANGGPDSVGEALRIVSSYGLVELDERWIDHLATSGDSDISPVADGDRQVLGAFMTCDIHELHGYFNYVGRESPYSTQQGVKGAEFPNVLVVLDDAEGTHAHFSYDKLFGLRKLSKADETARQEGRDSVLERTRRLLYVCCSRATESLTVLLYTDDVPDALDALRRSSLGATGLVIDLAEIEIRHPGRPDPQQLRPLGNAGQASDRQPAPDTKPQMTEQTQPAGDAEGSP
ncbi:UvrD-helicase domain-containing protein [Nonomuraea sp. NPDC059194]|uniref:UvrD-helicase domain-containing protein n=1 Tax=Nonomuraea sp. NPDC059194 TaxID=3346764 RepID=UPI0036AF8208